MSCGVGPQTLGSPILPASAVTVRGPRRRPAPGASQCVPSGDSAPASPDMGRLRIACVRSRDPMHAEVKTASWQQDPLANARQLPALPSKIVARAMSGHETVAAAEFREKDYSEHNDRPNDRQNRETPNNEKKSRDKLAFFHLHVRALMERQRS